MEFDQKYQTGRTVRIMSIMIDQTSLRNKTGLIDWCLLNTISPCIFVFFFTVITGRISRPKTTSYGCTIWLRKRATPRLATDICAPLGIKLSSCWKNWKSPCWVIILAMKWRTQCAVPIAQTFHSWRKLSLFVRVRGGKWNVRVFFSLICFKSFQLQGNSLQSLFIYVRAEPF